MRLQAAFGIESDPLAQDPGAARHWHSKVCRASGLGEEGLLRRLTRIVE